MNKIKISENFSLHEFACKDGSELVKVHEKLIEKLQKMRDTVGKPIKVLSGYRTPEYNKKVGGSKESQHCEGTAADITIPGMNVEDIAKLAERIGFDGIGVYPSQNFVHVDVRGSKARWRG